MIWHPFPAELPPERRHVLVAIAAAPGELHTFPGMAVGLQAQHAPAVAVGWLRIWSDGPFFVVPGFGREFVVTHWADVLPDDWHAPEWVSARPRQPASTRSAPDATNEAQDT